MGAKPKTVEEIELHDRAEAEANIAQMVEDESSEVKTVEETDSGLIAIPIDTVPLNVALPCSIYVKIGGRYPILRQQGERLSARRLLGLQEKGAQSLYIHKAVWNVFLRNMEALELPEPVTPQARAQHLRQLLLSYGKELERKIREPKRPLFEKLKRLTSGLADMIAEDPSLGAQLLRKYSEPNVAFVGHAVNCTVYASIIAYKLRYSKEDMRLIAYGALIHDIGELFISKAIRYKKFEYTDEERQQMETHARRGAEFVQTMGVPPVVVRMVMQHHERMDGQGYPSGLIAAQIHPFAKLCAVADTYDSLTTSKAYREALSPSQAIEKMRSMQGHFDPQILGMVASE